MVTEPSSRRTLPLKAAYPFGQQHGLAKEINEICDMEIEWDSSYDSSVRRGYLIALFADKGILDAFIKEYWPEGLTPWGQSKMRFFRRLKQRYEDYLCGETSDIEEEDNETTEDREFAAEADLRDFLAKNLQCIETGLRLYEKDGVKGIEFKIDDGRIDLLAVDKDNRFVVIELKVSRGRNKALGQLLYYMGWVDERMGHGPCRGMIIAKEITNDLKLAVQRASGVLLYAYTLSVSVRKVL